MSRGAGVCERARVAAVPHAKATRMPLTIVSAGLITSGCVSARETGGGSSGACRFGAPMVETMLEFGLQRPGSAAFRSGLQRFVHTEIGPYWKKGSTLLEERDLRYSERRRPRECEPGCGLIRLHDGDRQACARVEAIRPAYITSFGRYAVLCNDRQTRVSFLAVSPERAGVRFLPFASGRSRLRGEAPRSANSPCLAGSRTSRRSRP